MPSRTIIPDQGEFRSIAGFPPYEVNVHGRVHRKRDGSRVMPRLLDGVLVVDVPCRSLRERPWVPVALLVARAWLPRLPGKKHLTHHVHLIDGNPEHVQVSNVVWMPDRLCERAFCGQHLRDGPARRSSPVCHGEPR